MAGGFCYFFLATYYFGTMLPAMHTLNTQSFEQSWKSRHGSTTQGLWHDTGAKPNRHTKNNLHSTQLYCLILKMTNNNNTQMLEEEPEGDEEIWLGAIRQKVGKHLFGNIQFITCEEDEKFGSVWQKLLCRQLPGCPIEKQELFWKTKGMTEARKALNRKRQNTNNAMKREFIGKLNIIWSGEKQ